MGTKKPMSKKPRQILFSKNTYNPKVKVAHWEYQMLAEKKDNYVYRDSLSNHVSTYRRLGNQKDEFITETGHMLGQILTKKDFIYSFKPMKNCNSYSDAESPESTEDHVLEFCSSPYTTTHQSDYRNPHPTVMKPLSVPLVPWLLNRVICSDLTQNYGTEPPAGDYQFLDTHTPIHHIRRMRLCRHQSFNPHTCTRDFPAVQLSEA
ncbi:uncharacterized protein LOC121727139 [Aricia agestis]|uniref:uncharacterized protein LOC121727139 n=1 Tax=Aricia agestis TaxID=91739 RepID=UPI001C2083E6|nr:uncharacterized protein LOC121727139 [Aricia agestis]